MVASEATRGDAMNIGQRNALLAARYHARALVAAARGNGSRCGSFSPMWPARDPDKRQEQIAKGVAVYIDSWLLPALEATIASLDGVATTDEAGLIDWYKLYPEPQD